MTHPQGEQPASKEQRLPRNPRSPDYDPNEALEAWVQMESDGDPERARELREYALNTPVMRDFL